MKIVLGLLVMIFGQLLFAKEANVNVVSPTRLRYKCVNSSGTPKLVIASSINGKTLATKLFDRQTNADCAKFVSDQLEPLLKKAESGQVEFTSDLSSIKVHETQTSDASDEPAPAMKDKPN